MNAHDIELALRARATFNDSVDRIDADTRRRLRDLRLHAQQGDPRHSGIRWIWPAGAAVTAALALAVFLPPLPHAPTNAAPAASVAIAAPHAVSAGSAAHENPSAIAGIATPGVTDASSTDAPTLETTDPDMLSDLDFYGWLARQPNASNSGG
jgi:hypothetical protein